MARIAEEGRVASTRNNSILYNGDFSHHPAVIVAQTTTANRWIDGTSGGSIAKTAYGWATPSTGSGVGANGAIGFDTTIFRSGDASMKLSTLNASGAVTAANIRTIAPTATSNYGVFPLQPSMTYTGEGYIRTNNVANNGAFIDFRELDAAFVTLATHTTNKLSGTDTSWRKVTVTFTTGSNARFGYVLLRNNVTGNTSDAWFADLKLVPAELGRVLNA